MDNIDLLKLVAAIVSVGIGTSLIMDLWALLLKRLFAIPSLNYDLVGRCLTYMPRGIVRHDNIAAVKPVAYEAILGWSEHYLIGIIFAALLVIINSSQWLIAPTLNPAIAFGAFSVAFPFL